jgi:hypothetical protein
MYLFLIHANYHLLRHARTFGTLTNIEIGVKEQDVSQDFKNLVPHTNLDLDLLKRYTTLQSIRLGIGIDSNFENRF